MERIKQKVKKHHIISAFALGGLAFAAMNFNNPPLFNNTDNFVLFAQEEIKLEQEVQVSSGDLGSNKNLDIDKDVLVNGNLFADRITLEKNVTINGNASFNRLKVHKEAQILGTQTKPVSLPIAQLPEIPAFDVGTQDFRFEGNNNTLAPGNYRDIVIEKNSRLELTNGIYNLRKLELKDGAVLIFNAPAIINIQFKLRGRSRVSILPGQNLKPDDLKIDYLGIKPKKEKGEKEDDDDEIDQLHDDKEKKDFKKGKIGRPVVFGKSSFLNFKLLAPKAKVEIGKESTVRGQVLARKIKIEKESILSREEVFVKESDPEKVVTDTDGSVFVVNEILVNFVATATLADARGVADLVEGRVVGFVESANTYQIEVFTDTTQELSDKIGIIRQSSDPLIEGVFRSYVLELTSL